jgi:hypothetical protein
MLSFALTVIDSGARSGRARPPSQFRRPWLPRDPDPEEDFCGATTSGARPIYPV